MDAYSFWLFVYVAVMCWIILGTGIRLPELRHWEIHHPKVPIHKRLYEVIRGVLLWPWCNINKLWRKYDDNATSS